MTRLVARLWLLVAVLLLPLGMSGPAMAAAPEAHHAMAGMPISHCPDQPSTPKAQPGFAACTMICAAALPAFDTPSPTEILRADAPHRATSAKALAGVQPEAATPPPRIA